MCRLQNTNLGILSLDFSQRGKFAATLTDGRTIICPLSMFPDIKGLTRKQREKWCIMDDQFFSFNLRNFSPVYAVTDLLRL